MPTRVIMPQLGESVVEGTVTRWLKREGDPINELEPLLEISTDKVDTEIPSPGSGVVLKILVPEGVTVERGVLLAVIGQPGEAFDAAAPAPTNGHGHTPAGLAPAAHNAAVSAPAVTAAQGEYTGHVTPVVARMVAEHRLDLSQIPGTGRDGRVTKKDVEAYLAARPQHTPAPTPELAPWERPGSGDLFKPTVEYGALPPAAEPRIPPKLATGEFAAARPPALPAAPLPPDAPGELVPMTPMRRSIAEHMVRSKLQVSPHATTIFEVDMSAVTQHRGANKASFAKQGVALTFTAYFAGAAVAALQANPFFNARWREDGIYLLRAINLGIAVAMSTNGASNEGLIVPVIPNAQDLNLTGLARAIGDLAERARARKLKPDEVQGGTFTISNHGVSGSIVATPIINQPQVGILGIGMVEQRVKVINGMIAVRPCCYVSLTFDHRVADGAAADAFMTTFKLALENWK